MKKIRLFLCCVILLLCACTKEVAQDGTFTQLGTIQGPAEAIASIVISPDGQTIAYGTFADNLIRIVDVATMQEIRTLSGHTKPVTALAISPNGQFLASTGTVNLPPEIDGTVRLWNLADGNQIASVETAPAGTSQLTFSPDGSVLAGAGGGGTTLTLHLWNAANLNLVRNLTGVFRMVSFSPDGSHIATGKRDEKVYILDAATGNEISSFSGHTGWIRSVAYRSDGQTLATGGEDRKILIRNAQNGQTSLTLTGHTSYPDYLEFSPDHSMIASLGSGMNITRTPSGGISISLSNADKILRIWDLNTGLELPRLNVESDIISKVSFSSDWNILVTGSDSGLIRIFEWTGSSSIPTGQMLAAQKSIINYPNPFTCQTTIEYLVEPPKDGRISIYNEYGQLIKTFVEEIQLQGLRQVVWNAEGMKPGVYYCHIMNGKKLTVHKMLKM